MRRSFSFLLITVLIDHSQALAQEPTVRPVHHSLPSGLKSLNGSIPHGGCTSVNGDICDLRDGNTSVLVDNTILPLSGLGGNQWARDLYTVDRGTNFTFIAFDFGTSVRIKSIELVSFDCPQWSIGVGTMIELHLDGSVELFPRPDPVLLIETYTYKLFPKMTNNSNLLSCKNVYNRVCVRIRAGLNVRLYYIAFPNATGFERVYLAETIFYTDSKSCGHDPDATVSHEPVTQSEAKTTGESESDTVTVTQEPTPPPPEPSQPGTANTPKVPIIAIVLIALSLITTIIVMVLLIPLYVHYKRVMRSSSNVSKPEIAATVTTISNENHEEKVFVQHENEDLQH